MSNWESHGFAPNILREKVYNILQRIGVFFARNYGK